MTGLRVQDLPKQNGRLFGARCLSLRRNGGRRFLFVRMLVLALAEAADEVVQAVHLEEDDRRDEQRQDLRDDETADDGDTERLAKLRAGATADGDR